MTSIWIVRHGTTDKNLDYYMIGQTDSSLGNIGRSQATAVAVRLRETPFKVIYSSPLSRAKETAEAVSEENMYHPTVIFHEDLQEIHLGEFEDVSSFAAYEQHRELMDKALAPSLDDFSFPGGELRSTAAVRFQNVILSVASSHPHDEICIVSHGAVIGSWLASVYGKPLGAFRQYQPSHASISKVQVSLQSILQNQNDERKQEVHGKGQSVHVTIEIFDDTSHLQPSK
ncbi:histidine phosphatase family protein [Alicyclobacillus sp. SO9]|uniref:histidine phosphatase family protein n=1 Tax=Alicyclobacillus sp. SO9 TaxID=2665646 RepID=UPI0018E8665B|nr:histidine phosphatase family protein [Alicyclobacillus sp. SO9]QQE79689.1 histidine phosphatase family protein [Alicyclobacillus sp. SO9]